MVSLWASFFGAPLNGFCDQNRHALQQPARQRFSVKRRHLPQLPVRVWMFVSLNALQDARTQLQLAKAHWWRLRQCFHLQVVLRLRPGQTGADTTKVAVLDRSPRAGPTTEMISLHVCSQMCQTMAVPQPSAHNPD
jgi:hypothetical protein